MVLDSVQKEKLIACLKRDDIDIKTIIRPGVIGYVINNSIGMEQFFCVKGLSYGTYNIFIKGQKVAGINWCKKDGVINSEQKDVLDVFAMIYTRRHNIKAVINDCQKIR